jgi:hypothetical protein
VTSPQKGKNWTINLFKAITSVVRDSSKYYLSSIICNIFYIVYLYTRCPRKASQKKIGSY